MCEEYQDYKYYDELVIQALLNTSVDKKEDEPLTEEHSENTLTTDEFIKLYDERKSIESFLNEVNGNPTTVLGKQLAERYNTITDQLAKACVERMNTMKVMLPTPIVKVKQCRDITPITKIHKGDWLDLCAADDIYMTYGEYRQIPLGVCIELPKGYEGIIAPRSSTFKKYGIIMTNSIGIIDETYCGDSDEWQFPALCLVKATHIPAGTRICQFRILPHQPQIRIVNVETLNNENRGGFGSTG